MTREARWRSFISVHPDFPKPGVRFLDLSPALADPVVWSEMTIELAAVAWQTFPTHILGLDARGFLIGMSVAQKLQLPFVMARKPGKLPGHLNTVEYDLEYGKNCLSVQKRSFGPGDRVAIIDDVLATGGTARAAIELIRMDQAEVCYLGCLIEIASLGGRKLIEKEMSEHDIYCLLSY
jgi:adenine phosphoribosyltransferase